MGGGKSYHAQKSFVNGMEGPTPQFLEGDSVLPPKMMELISNFKPLTKEMVTSFVKDNLYTEIVKRLDTGYEYDSIVVSQALYSNQNRIDLIDMLSSANIEVIMVWVKPPFWRNLKQIWSRPNGLKWVLYWLMNKPFFEKPTHHHVVIK
jgi:hypothetical protein